jgi:Transposase zinc-binding domain
VVQPRYRHHPHPITRWTPMLAAPARDWRVFQHIFAEHWEVFQHTHPRYQTPYDDALVRKMLDGGTPAQMGSVEYRCLHCGQGKPLVSLSCQASLGLRWAKVSTDDWGSQGSQVLHEGGIYRHVSLTVAAMFRTPFYQTAAVLWRACMRCGAHGLDAFYSTVRGKTLPGGSSTGLHTHGRHGQSPPIGICSPPAGALRPRAHAGSISSLGPLPSCAVSGRGSC